MRTPFWTCTIKPWFRVQLQTKVPSQTLVQFLFQLLVRFLGQVQLQAPVQLLVQVQTLHQDFLLRSLRVLQSCWHLQHRSLPTPHTLAVLFLQHQVLQIPVLPVLQFHRWNHRLLQFQYFIQKTIAYNITYKHAFKNPDFLSKNDAGWFPKIVFLLTFLCAHGDFRFLVKYSISIKGWVQKTLIMTATIFKIVTNICRHQHRMSLQINLF